MSDRVCIRGCVQRGVHYATCDWFGVVEDPASPAPAGSLRCRGCAPKPARDHALICDTCFYRLRTLVRDADDLMGRLRSLADPMKATPTDKAPGGRSALVEAPAPVNADLLDALNDLGHTLHDWGRHTDYRLEQCLPDLVNDVESVRILGVGFLDRHPLVDGVREFWSVQDAVDKWGVERRTKGESGWEPEVDRELVAFAVKEWGDPLVAWPMAAQIAGSEATLRRWIRNEEITPSGTVVIAGVSVRYFHMNDLTATRDRLAARKLGALKQNAREGSPGASG